MFNEREMPMAQGSCLCGAVTYEVTGTVGDIVHCHCSTCRKAHASAFSSFAGVADEDFVLSGREHMKSFESSPGKQRYFCGTCGSQIYAKKQGTGHVILRHIWLSDKASWYALHSDLEEREEF